MPRRVNRIPRWTFLVGLLCLAVSPQALAQPQALLIQDDIPWGSQAWQGELANAGIPYVEIGSADLAAENLLAYDLVITSSVSGGTYNLQLINQLTEFESYVTAGGVVIWSGCTQNGQHPYPDPPFGGINEYDADYTNVIVDALHPLLDGVTPPITGSSSSHNTFDQLPIGAHVILEHSDTGDPVLYVLEDGLGMLIATGLTWEFGWGQGWENGTILVNALDYGWNHNPCTGADGDGDGWTDCDGDCDDTDEDVHPGAAESCNDGVDSNCDGQLDELADHDGDGFTNCSGDCDDFQAEAYPGGVEVCDFVDNDCDGWVDENMDLDGDGYTECQGDCDDGDPAVNPGADEVCNGIDDDCDGDADEGFDEDGDGWTVCDGDCDDNDDTVYPGAPEICDQQDNDCNGLPDEFVDVDGDGSTVCDGDCDDQDPAVYPGANETLNQADDDCDGWADEDFLLEGDVIIAELMHDPLAVLADYGEWIELFNTTPFDINLIGWRFHDGGQYGDEFVVEDEVIVPVGGVVLLANNDDPAINGGLPAVDYMFPRVDYVLGSQHVDYVVVEVDGLEIDRVEYDITTWPTAQGYSMSLDTPDHDGVANDDPDSWCLADPAWTYGDGDRGSPGVRNHPCCLDEDGDGHTTCGADGIAATGDEDCDDADVDFHPGATELCDGLDNDCDTFLPLDEQDLDGDGYLACDGDCDDLEAEVYPLATEICDGIADNNCDGNLDYNDIDDDGDGVAECAGDCSDLLADVYPGAPELCDGLDNDCNGTVDDGVVFEDWYEDADGDGYGNPAVSQSTCEGAPGPDWVTDGTDCDDANPNTNPGAEEACEDGADQDCDGLIDEADPDCSGDDDTGDDDTGDDDTGDDDTGDDDTGDDDTGDDDTGDDDSGDDDASGDDDDDDDDDDGYPPPNNCSCRQAPVGQAPWALLGFGVVALGLARRRTTAWRTR